jgi:hypothetical protein
MTGRSMPEYGSTMRVAVPRPALVDLAAGAGEGDGDGDGDADGDGDGDGDGVKLGRTLGAVRARSDAAAAGDGTAVAARVISALRVASTRAVTGAVYESRPETTNATPTRAISVDRRRARDWCSSGMGTQRHGRGTPPSGGPVRL